MLDYLTERKIGLFVWPPSLDLVILHNCEKSKRRSKFGRQPRGNFKLQNFKDYKPGSKRGSSWSRKTADQESEPKFTSTTPKTTTLAARLTLVFLLNVAHVQQRVQGTSKIFPTPPFSAIAWALAASLSGSFRLIGITSLPSRTASPMNSSVFLSNFENTCTAFTDG